MTRAPWICVVGLLSAACHRAPSDHDRPSGDGWASGDPEGSGPPIASTCELTLDRPNPGPFGRLRRWLGLGEPSAKNTAVGGVAVDGVVRGAVRCWAATDVIPRLDLVLDAPAGVVVGDSRFTFGRVPSAAWRDFEARLSERFVGAATVVPTALATDGVGTFTQPLRAFYALGTGTSVLVGQTGFDTLKIAYADLLLRRGAIHEAPSHGGGATVETCGDSVPAPAWGGAIEDPARRCALGDAIRSFGGLTVGEVVQAVSPHRAELQACLLAAVPPGALRSVSVDYVVQDRRARFVTPAARQPGLPEGVLACLTSALEAVTFPAQASDAVSFVSMAVTVKTKDGRTVH
jgi:hypothetical protein